MNKKYIVSLYHMPDYWENFLNHCNDIAQFNDRNVKTVIDNQLKPNGKYIDSTLIGGYLCWDDEKYHTLFLLRWS